MAPAGNRVIAGLVLIASMTSMTSMTMTDGTAMQPSSGSGTGLMVGRVVDAATGRPIGGAIVTLQGTSGAAVARRSSTMPQPDAGRQPPILTGTDGYFVFRGLPTGAFTIGATKPGYADGASGRRRPGGPSQAVTLEAGERVGDVVVRLWKHGSLSGSVVDEIGEPVVGMTVRAYRRSAAGGSRRFVPSGAAMTDDRGIYRIRGLVPGEYIVCACARQSTMPLEMAFSRGAGPGNGGTPGAGGPYPIQVGDTTLGVAPGPAFALVGNRLLTYPPVFQPEGTPSADAQTISLISGEERTGIDLQIAAVPGVRVSGTLSSPDGIVDGVPMRLVHEVFEHTALQQESPTTLTDRNGRFTFPSVPAGRYTLRVIRRAPGINPPQTEAVFWIHMLLVIGRTDVDGIAVVLQDGLRITGQFDFEGTSDRAAVRLPQVPVVLEPADASPGAPPDDPAMLLGPNPVDPAGHFKTVGVPAGRYFLRVSGSPVGWMFKAAMLNGIDVSETPLDLHDDVGGVVITFTDRWTGIRGTVRTARSQPDEGASVLLFPSDPQRWSNHGAGARRTRSTRTSKWGDVLVDVAARRRLLRRRRSGPGRGRLAGSGVPGAAGPDGDTTDDCGRRPESGRPSHARGPLMRAAAALLAGSLIASSAIAQQPRDGVRPMLAGAGRIWGVVTSDAAEPKPLRRARVTLSGGELIVGRTVLTGDDGSFAFDGLPSGRYTVGAVKDAYVPVSFGAKRPGRPGTAITLRGDEQRRVTIALPRGAAITGIITDPEGQPASDVGVMAFTWRYLGTLGERRLVPAATSVPPTDDRGVYRIFGLPAGEYLIAAQRFGPRSGPGDLVVLSSADVKRALADVAVTASRPLARTPGPTAVAPAPAAAAPSDPPRRVGFAQIFYPGTAALAQARQISVAAGEERAAVDFQLDYVPTAAVAGVVVGGGDSGSAEVVLTQRDPAVPVGPRRGG